MSRDPFWRAMVAVEVVLATISALTLTVGRPEPLAALAIWTALMIAIYPSVRDEHRHDPRNGDDTA